MYLLGFSQGSILAYPVGLTHPESIGGVLAFSGRMLQEAMDHPAPLAQIRNVRFYIRYGTQDGTLPEHYARQALEFLHRQKVAVNHFTFNGGHDMPAESIHAARLWLYSNVSANDGGQSK